MMVHKKIKRRQNKNKTRNKINKYKTEQHNTTRTNKNKARQRNTEINKQKIKQNATKNKQNNRSQNKQTRKYYVIEKKKKTFEIFSLIMENLLRHLKEDFSKLWSIRNDYQRLLQWMSVQHTVRFPCQMMFMSFNSYTAGVTSGAGTAISCV